MRIAIVSDIHANLTAFDAVLADLRAAAPDLVMHGGDIADGPGGAEVVDRIRELGWPGVMGNTDEMLADPDSLERFAAATPAMAPLMDPIREMAAYSREALGEARLAWLGALPPIRFSEDLALFHASPSSCWKALAPGAEVDVTSKVAVYGHIHQPSARSVGTKVIANSGSVGLPYDGDRRASYLLIDESEVTIRRLEYDVDKEIARIAASGSPHHQWVAKMLSTARPQLP